MEFTAFKTIGILGATAATSTGAYGIYWFSSSQKTIRSQLEAHFKGTNFVFLHSNHPEWSKLGTWYSKVSNKPKKGETTLTLNEVKSWCSENVEYKFKSSSDPRYIQVKELCFLNTNTLLQESGKSSLRSTEGSSHEEWKTAWEEYHKDSEKEKKGIKIMYSTKDADLNGSSTDKNKGGVALQEWCFSNSSKKMYDSEASWPAFKAWCVK
ncbi:hypothetical protein MHC_02175 [Mycoplasma haemocanis str. Illinois]|uniref:Uncharacterized protein n=1 Tax=Mycoplasma haemocanis (strain Illinois) TaxID=1111676 RepID=H6N6M9_MYCHN|nr:hypothetical protein [Mycoplasma haemocanis]AEW45301.1 hypothetical protein MHC_02175 [Mycoplasma haemocanis str. Illinois]